MIVMASVAQLEMDKSHNFRVTVQDQFQQLHLASGIRVYLEIMNITQGQVSRE